MRYFKYEPTNTVEKRALRAQYAMLTKKEKKLVRKKKALNVIATVCFFTISITCFVSSLWALYHIPVSQNKFSAILGYIGIFILGFGALIVSFLIGAVVALPIWGKANIHNNSLRQSMLSEACRHLRDYYELQEPCIVTKCYEASDKKFNNHDVCIFIVGKELRITVNLKHGFFNGENDLGCYAFKLEEISLIKLQGESFLIAELKAENVFFMLGYRAKSFIEKNFFCFNYFDSKHYTTR